MDTPGWLSDEEYDFVFDRVPRLCVDLVIKSEKGILLSLRDIEPYEGLWHLPGGMVYKDEPIHSAIKRIAQKETGLEIRVNHFLGYMEFLHAIQNNHNRHMVSIVFDTYPIDANIKPKKDFQAKKIEFHSFLPENIVTQHQNLLIDHKLLTFQNQVPPNPV